MHSQKCWPSPVLGFSTTLKFSDYQTLSVTEYFNNNLFLVKGRKYEEKDKPKSEVNYSEPRINNQPMIDNARYVKQAAKYSYQNQNEYEEATIPGYDKAISSPHSYSGLREKP